MIFEEEMDEVKSALPLSKLLFRAFFRGELWFCGLGWRRGAAVCALHVISNKN